MSDFALDKAFTLDASLDDIEDLPGFSVFPSGAHQVELADGIVYKANVGNHPAMTVNMKLEQTLELTEALDPDEKAPIAGDICGIAFMMDNKVGAHQFKLFVAEIAKRLGTSKMSELCVDENGAGANKSKGMKLVIVTKRTYDDKKDRHFCKIKKVAVL